VARVRLREIVVCAGAFAAGSVAAFFGAGPALFADGDLGERLVTVAVTMGVYALLGLLMGALAPSMWKVAAMCLILPLLPVAALFGGDASSSLPVALALVGTLLGSTASALSGALAGSRLRAGH